VSFSDIIKDFDQPRF